MTRFTVSRLTPQASFGLVFTRNQMELPYGAACEDCGTSHPLQLRRPTRWGQSETYCLECSAVRNGRSPTQVHHLGGRFDPGVTVEAGANLHGVLTQLQVSYWHGIHDPGSPYALGFDVGALVAAKLLGLG